MKLGLVSRVESEFNCSLFLTKKKTPEGAPPKYRIVQNLKGLNSVTKPSNFRLNRIDECLDRIALKGSKIFSSVDLRHGYYNLEIEPKDRKKTAFWCEGLGQLAWNVAAQGLVNCPATFSRVIHRVFRKQIEKFEIENYLDDLLCHAKTHADMLRILEEVFESLRKAGLELNLEKCTWGASSLVYLGFKIDKNGYTASPDNVRTITNAREPISTRMVRSYIGLLNFYFHTIPNYSQLIKPLTSLISKNSTWHGGKLPLQAKLAYEKVKKIMSNPPFIHHPNFNWKFHLYTDGSLGQMGTNSGGISGCLVQYEDDKMTNHPRCLGFASRSLRGAEKAYSSFLIENLALSYSIDFFSKYLVGRHFYCYVDHRPMCNLNNTQKRTLLRLRTQCGLL